MQRTIRLKLTPSPAQAVSLAETSRRFTGAFNPFVRLGWAAQVGNATKLHYLAYYPVRTSLLTLNSNLINTARAKAAEALRSAFALQEQGCKVTMPQSDACPPRYNVHTYRVERNSAAKYHARAGRPRAGGLPVNQPIVSVPVPRHQE